MTDFWIGPKHFQAFTNEKKIFLTHFYPFFSFFLSSLFFLSFFFLFPSFFLFLSFSYSYIQGDSRVLSETLTNESLHNSKQKLLYKHMCFLQWLLSGRKFFCMYDATAARWQLMLPRLSPPRDLELEDPYVANLSIFLLNFTRFYLYFALNYSFIHHKVCNQMF